MSDSIKRADAVQIHEDGTLEVKVPNAVKVGRVLVIDEVSRIGGGLYYPESTNDNWISVSERLPNEVDLYLVSLGEEVVETMGWNGEEFVKHGAKWSFDFITAWQPLPKPYKESEVEE